MKKNKNFVVVLLDYGILVALAILVVTEILIISRIQKLVTILTILLITRQRLETMAMHS